MRSSSTASSSMMCLTADFEEELDKTLLEAAARVKTLRAQGLPLSVVPVVATVMLTSQLDVQVGSKPISIAQGHHNYSLDLSLKSGKEVSRNDYNLSIPIIPMVDDLFDSSSDGGEDLGGFF
ncbi:hypothetical protein AALP_AA6G250300 [Arabis alpina]|uniref:Uncharacterized protein n=1 Tax=Arabis alpina TaxID=50452 RepID=A0A087GRJ7_ARAAL|nr:hypothetical protein AALP_AA6G250300 [Arabis alpina]